MLQLVDLAVLGLACWRLARLIQFERGPWSILVRLREWAGIEHTADGEPVVYPEGSELRLLLQCLDCGSVWIGLGLVGLYVISAQVAYMVALPLALSGIAVLLEVHCNGKS